MIMLVLQSITSHLSADLSSNEITHEGVEQLVNFLKELPHLRYTPLQEIISPSP